MIGDIDIRVNASSPHLPIGPVCAVEGSAQRIRVLGVPTRQDDWRLVSVAVEMTYPDGALQSVECARDGYAWTATVPASTTSGRVERGVTISARDEQGGRYVLGTGDLYIIGHGAVPSPDMRTWAVRLCDAKPEAPTDGDLWLDGDTMYLYHGGEAHTAMDMTPYATQTDIQETAADLCAYTVSRTDEARRNGIYLVSEPWRMRGDRVYQRLIPAGYDYGQWRLYHMYAAQWIDAAAASIEDDGSAWCWHLDMGSWGAPLTSVNRWTYTPGVEESRQAAYASAARATEITVSTQDTYWRDNAAVRDATEVPEHWEEVDRLAMSSEVSSQMADMAADVSRSCREYTDQSVSDVQETVDGLSTQMASYDADLSSLSNQVRTSIQDRLVPFQTLQPGQMLVHAPTETSTTSRAIIISPRYTDERVYRSWIWCDYTNGLEPLRIHQGAHTHVYHTGGQYALSALPAGNIYMVDIKWWTLSGETTVQYYPQIATQD